jgi:DNA invertase Pin-like site-specific DNA recombinase
MKAQNKSRQPVTATASLKSGEDRIVRALFSHLVRCIRFESKDVATQSLTIKWLVVVICGCLGAFGIGISTNLAQSATLALWLVLPLAAVAIRQSKAAPASYTRFSSENQNERSITDQQRKCRNRASSDGRPISPELEFFDEAQSGARHDRAGFEKMLAAARAGLITDLYFESLSRLARDCVLTLQVLRELVYVYKTRIVSVDEGLDTAVTANWELLAAIFGIQHEQFLKTLSAQVFRAQEGVVLDMLSVGDYCLGFGGEPVPGTESKRRGKEPVPKSKYIILWAEAEWVIKIFVWFVK